MATREFADGQVRIELPSWLQASERDERTRSLDPADDTLAEVADELRRNGFEVVITLDLTERGLRGGDRPRALESVPLSVSAAPGEEAVVLTERGGVWSWHEPTAPTRDLSGDRGFSIRAIPGVALVLRFAAPAITGLAIKILERDVAEGLVHITAPDADSWVPIDSPGRLGLKPGARVLLLVHGTFSSTHGGFWQLGEPAADTPAFIAHALQKYDAVVGFDHKTLSVDPRSNADDIYEELLRHTPTGTVIDIVSHSRGGLVARCLVEQVLPGKQWDGIVDRMVFVGVPNAGTNFAEPERWTTLVDLYTNLLVASGPGGVVLGSGLKAIGALVKYLSAYFVNGGGVPGLAAMEPDGDFIETLNRHRDGEPRPTPPWFAVTSNFHAGDDDTSLFTAAFRLWLTEIALDDLLDDDNDLVVDTGSMTAIDTAAGDYVRNALEFGTNSVVHHTNYFAQHRVAAALKAWLIDGRDTWRVPQPTPPSRGDVFERAIVRGGGGFGFDAGPMEFGAPPPPPPPSPLPPPAEAAVTAHVRAEMPAKITVGVPLAVRTLLSRNEIKVTSDTITATEVFEMLVRETLTVELKIKKNLTVNDGRSSDLIGLPAGSGVSTVDFEVVPTTVGPVELTVLLRRQSGEIAANLTLRGDARDPGDPDRRRRMIRQQVVAAAATSMVLDDAVWLEIWQTDGPDYVQFAYELRQKNKPALHFQSEKLADHKQFVANLFAGMEREWRLNSDRPKAFRRFLQDRGSDLFERLFPDDMQAVLWDLRDELTSILLLADEPYFPWEIVHLKPPTGPRQDAPRFLAQYGLLRWQFLPFPGEPVLRARPGKVYTLCPREVEPRYLLPESIEEAKWLATELQAREVRASPTAVKRLLRNGDFDVLHFSGHGQANTTDIADARIMLDDRLVAGNFERQFLDATTVTETAKLATGPLVVLNACQAGLGGVQLSSLGGFARAFLAAGAQAFVACLWSVDDQPSRLFTESLYRNLLDGTPLAQAVLRAREAARADEAAATWLAYVVYGRPDATLILN